MMKRAILSTVMACALGAVAGAQQAPDAKERLRMELVALQAASASRMTLETRVTPGAPYSAEAVTEFVQTLADGNRIVRKTTTRVYRDSDGRTRRETVNDAGEITEIVISDPAAGSSFILDPVNRTAQKMPGGFAMMTGVGVAGRGTGVGVGVGGRAGGTVTVMTPSGGADERTRVIVNEKIAEASTGFVARARVAGPPPTREDLGDQTIEGVSAKGTRTTTTIPAGTIGNEQPLTTVSEQWFSDELKLLVLTKHTDPRVGETTYRLMNMRRAEPDRSLFQVPSDYTVKESNMRRPMMFQQQQ